MISTITTHWRPFLRFGAVGSLGFIVDAAILYALIGLGLHPLSARAVSFLSAVIVTWALNRSLVFPRRDNKRRINELARYLLSSTSGGIVNYGVFSGVVLAGPDSKWIPLLGLAAGSVLGWIMNYSLSNRYVFGQIDHRENDSPSRLPPFDMIAMAPIIAMVTTLCYFTVSDLFLRSHYLFGDPGFDKTDAVLFGNVSLTDKLLSQNGGVDDRIVTSIPLPASVKVPQHLTLLFVASASGSSELVSVILRHNPSVSIDGNALSLCAAIAGGSSRVVRHLVESDLGPHLVLRDCDLTPPDEFAYSLGEGSIGHYIARHREASTQGSATQNGPEGLR